VEFGCGLGYVTRWAASEGAHATGIDLNEDHLMVATELAQEAGLKTAHFRPANVYEPGLEPDSVDVSYSRWLMVHLKNPVGARDPCVFEAGRSDGVRGSGCECRVC
jgi:2-polyprenyl-3-methyl-5-hydroxy-6-metoxy-1,4-benzoquinol methylase